MAVRKCLKIQTAPISNMIKFIISWQDGTKAHTYSGIMLKNNDNSV